MKKLIVFVLAILMCLSPFAFSGCNNNATPKDVVLADFEEWAPDFQLMTVYNRFGKITQNADKNYVKNGNYSAKLQVVGPLASAGKPIMLIPTSSERFNFSYKDFSEYNLVSAYIYNANEHEVNVTFGISASYDVYRSNYIDGTTYLLQPNQWTKIVYIIDVDFLSLLSDYQNIAGVYLQFDDTDAIYPEDGDTLYLDDVVLVSADKKQQPTAGLIQLDKTETYKEVCDFEKSYQKYVALAKRNADVDQTFETSVVTASDYGIEATRGEKVLRILRHPKKGTETIFNELQLPEILFKEAGFGDIPQTIEEYSSWYFCFDMYNADDSRHEYMSLWFSQSGYEKRYAPLLLLQGDRPDMGRKAGEWAKWHEGMHATCGKWTTFKISLYELSEGMASIDYAKTPGLFGISLYSHSGTTDWEMFVDNFRLEKGPALNYAK